MLADMCTSGFYGSDTQTMLVLGSPDNIEPRSSSAANTSQVRTGKEKAGNVVEGPTDENLHCREVLVLSFELQKYRRKRTWLIIFPTSEVTSPLPAFSLKYEDEFIESLKSEKYQYGVGLMDAANPGSERFSAVELHNMLDQQKLDLFLKIEFALSIVDGRQRRSCTQKTAGSAEPEIECISELHGWL